MKVCWFGLYESDYSRNRILIDGLRMNGVEVIECTTDYKNRGKYLRLLRELKKMRNQYDVIYCAFPINWNVIIARLFQRKPVVVDAFFPFHDAYVKDRKTTNRFSISALIFKFLDYINVVLADLVIADTQQHKNYWRAVYANTPIEVVPVGSDDSIFFPIGQSTKNDTFEVLFQGTFIPLQGVEKIVSAAELIKDHHDIKFTFIGGGQTFPDIKRLINDKKINIQLEPFMPLDELNKRINRADVLFGIFGDSQKTDRVIPNKVWQAVAIGKSVITKDTSAIRECFTDQELYLVANTPQAIAGAVLDLKKNREKGIVLAARALACYQKQYSVSMLGGQLKDYIENALVRSRQ
jgi:glycosyltransferase involved in cell wall biosynthesis